MIPVIKFSNLFHTGIVVHDIDAAKTEYTNLLGVTWAFQGELEMPVWFPSGSTTISFCYAYTSEGPHRLELVRELPGTLWTVTGPGQVHHVGYWCDDVAAASTELANRGLTVCAKVGVDDPDTPAPITLYQTKTGAYLEIVDIALQPMMFGETS